MITDAQFIEQEAELLAIFEREEVRSRARDKAGPKEHVEKVEAEREAASEARIRRIIEAARYEVVLKDTTSFLFNTFGAGIDGLAKAAFGALDPATRKGTPIDQTTLSNTKQGVTQEQEPLDNSERGNQ